MRKVKKEFYGLIYAVPLWLLQGYFEGTALKAAVYPQSTLSGRYSSLWCIATSTAVPCHLRPTWSVRRIWMCYNEKIQA